MTDLFSALALVLVIEGLAYAAFPEQMKRALTQLLNTEDTIIRVVALTCAAVGLIVLFMIRG